MSENDDLLKQAFEGTLSDLANLDCVGKAASPSVFVVYAHDNVDNPGPKEAYATVVKNVIQWLRGYLRVELISDKSVLPEWKDRENDTAAVENIVSNQICLMPKYDIQSDNGKIGSVDKVLLFGSAVLESYLEETPLQQYSDNIAQLSSQNLSIDGVESAIRKLVEQRCQDPCFHHVLTELALLGIRSSANEQGNNTIIPIALGGGNMRYISFLRGSDVYLKLESTPSLRDQHILLFKILSRLYPEQKTQRAIDAYQACYTHVAEGICGGSISDTVRVGVDLGTKIVNALDCLNKNGSAHYRVIAGTNIKDIKKKLRDLIFNVGKNPREMDQLVPEPCQDSLQWLITEDNYKLWKRSTSSCCYTVWASPGQGKSVLAKFVARDLRSLTESSKATTLYFTCFGRDTTLGFDTVEAISKSLCVQLLESLNKTMSEDEQVVSINPDLEDYLDNPERARNQTWRVYLELFAHLIKAISTRELYVIIDGLDECKMSKDDRGEFLSELLKLSNTVRPDKCVKLCLTSRPMESDIDIALSSSLYKLDLVAHHEDISLVIKSMVADGPTHRSLECKAFLDMWSEDIIKKLEAKVGNTFVWIRAIFAVLDQEPFPSLKLFDRCVKEIPLELEEMYNTLLARIIDTNKLGAKLLVLVVHAKRPLTVAEINAACCIDLEQQNITTDDLNYCDRNLKKSSVVSLIGTLVEIDHKNSLVFIHQSVKDFFTITNRFEEIYPDPELFCFQLCCTFLLVRRQVEYEKIAEGVGNYYHKFVNKWPFYDYACRNWDLHLGCKEYADFDIKRMPLLRSLLDASNPQARIWFSARFYGARGGRHPINYSPLYIAVILPNKVIATLILNGKEDHDPGIPFSVPDTLLAALRWPDLASTLRQRWTNSTPKRAADFWSISVILDWCLHLLRIAKEEQRIQDTTDWTELTKVLSAISNASWRSSDHF